MTFVFILVIVFNVPISFWACGGMVDTLVLGTSAKAWEFESLHAQISKKRYISTSFLISGVFSSEKLLLEFEREWAEAGAVLRLDNVQDAKCGIAVKRERARQSLHTQLKKKELGFSLVLFYCRFSPLQWERLEILFELAKT